MNKEQITKHGEVIKWFRDNMEKGVWYKTYKSDWVMLEEPSFHIEDYYAQNDEYAHIRKAQIDGKVIECKLVCSDAHFMWCSSSSLPDIYKEDISSLRIKPEEPKFKVGDWVVYPDGETIRQVQPNSMLDGKSNAEYNLWEPKEDEWVIYKDKEFGNQWNIIQFHKGYIDKYYPTEYIKQIEKSLR